MTDPTHCPDAAPDVLAADDAASDLRRVFAMHSASPPEDIAGGDRSPAINRVIASLGGGYGSTNLDVRDVRCLVVAFADAEGIIDALNSQLSSARADLARLRAPLAGDLAAIGARADEVRAAGDALALTLDDECTTSTMADESEALSRRDDAVRASAADVPTLLHHLAAQQAAHAAAVAAARAEATAAERARCVAVCRAVATGWPGDDVAAARMALSEAREFIDDGLDADAAAARYDAALAAPRGR